MIVLEQEYEYLKYIERALIAYLDRLYTKGLNADDYSNILETIKDIYRLGRIVEEKYMNLYGTKQRRRYTLTLSEEEDDYEYYLNRLNENEQKIFFQNRRIKRAFMKELNSILYEFQCLRRLLKDELIGYEPDEYIRAKCSIAHLIFANTKDEDRSKIKVHNSGTLDFICTYHYEKNPSLEVDYPNRYAHCHGCGKSYDNISYLTSIHDITESEAIALLCHVYDIRIPEFPQTDSAIARTYREALVSPEYLRLIKRTQKRTKSKIIKNAKTRFALDTYASDLKTLHRVKMSEPEIYIPPGAKPKSLILEPISKQD